MKTSRIRLKTIQLETDGGGRTQQQELPTERQRRKITLFFFCGNDFEAVKAHSEETVRTCSLGVVSLCRRNLGNFK